MLQIAEDRGLDSAAHPSQSYWHTFGFLEPDLLRVAILIKNQAFKEEAEWRIVSPAMNNYVEPEILYRVGSEMLIPYLKVPLVTEPNSEALFEQVFVGPTQHQNLAVNSLSMFLSRSRACTKVVNSLMTYRGK